MLALSSVIVVARSQTKCYQIDPDEDHLQQMIDCDGGTFDFVDKKSKNNGFKLSGVDDATADRIFYNKKQGKLVRENPKKFAWDVRIENSSMENLAVAFTTGRKHKATIRNNKLVDFFITTDPTEIISLELEVRGNKQLSMVSIYKLNKVPGVDLATSKIQHFQECFFDSKPLGSLAELEGCSGVEGDLVIDSSTNTANISSTLRIAEIRGGCLRIEKSKLTNLKFLEGLLDSRAPETCSDQSQNRYIKENSQLCLTSEEQIRWENYQLTYVGTCDDRCAADFATTNPTKPCQIVTGDVKITGKVDPTKLEHWDRVTVLEGTLEVDNTGLTEIEIFKKLKEIKNPSKFKRALTVTRNSKMKKFNLPKLKSITQQPDAWQGPVLFHQNNPAFKFSWPEYEKWQNITREKSPQIPGDGPPIVPTTPSPPGSTTLSQREIRAKNKSIKEANERTYYNGRVMLWIVVALVVVVIILFIAGGIYLCCIYCSCCRCPCPCKGKTAYNKKHEDHDDVVIKKPVDKKLGDGKPAAAQIAAPKAEHDAIESEQLTEAVDAVEYALVQYKKDVLLALQKSNKEHDHAKACQIARDAVEMPFKLSDMITNVNAEELDFKRVPPPTPEEKTSPKFYRFEQQKSQWLAYNPLLLNKQPTERMEKFDPHTVLKVLLTNCNEFFVTNYHLMADTIKYLSGPYYGGKSKNLLGKIDGPVTLATDIHSMLETLQVILNIDFDEKNDNKPKVHPAFRQKYVFLGDYVDRGHYGLECSVLVCLLARLFPGNFVILRGNHDQDIPFLEHDQENKPKPIEHTINKWGKALAEQRKDLKYPHHFADCLYFDYMQKVVAFMPYACLINGKIFACHGGVSLSMLRMPGTLDELFGKVPVPYDENVYAKKNGYFRYFGFATQKQIEEGKGNTPEKCTNHFKLGESDVPNEYTTKLDERKHHVKEFWDGKVIEGAFEQPLGYGMYAKLKKDKKIPVEIIPEYEPVHPWVYELMWSDPGTSFASNGNTRGAGNTYSYENVRQFCEKFGIDYIVRGHMMRFGVSPDGKVVNIYSNPYHLLRQNGKNYVDPENMMKEPMNPGHFASILRINPDGTRMFVFIWLNWEKERDQALLKTNWKTRREVTDERRRKMTDKRNAEALARIMKKTDGQEQRVTKKADKSNASQQSAEMNKSTPEKKSSQSTPEKQPATVKRTEKTSKKSEGETSRASGHEENSPKKWLSFEKDGLIQHVQQFPGLSTIVICSAGIRTGCVVLMEILLDLGDAPVEETDIRVESNCLTAR